MVAKITRQDRFIESVITFLKENNLDGINIDWEYPGYRRGPNARTEASLNDALKDKKRFTGFLTKMRNAFNVQEKKCGKK